MRILKRLILGLVSLAIILALVAVFLPSDYVIQRQITVNATPAKIHPLVGDLKRWPEWAPWQEDDPTIQITHGTKTEGVGASQSWTGDSGQGELVLVASSEERGIEYDLVIDRMFVSVASVRYQPKPESDGSPQTGVIWSMQGDVGWNLIGRYFVFAMDRMVGPMFERGLERLKVAVESPAK